MRSNADPLIKTVMVIIQPVTGIVRL